MGESKVGKERVCKHCGKTLYTTAKELIAHAEECSASPIVKKEEK